jgi:hypothetical protein
VSTLFTWGCATFGPGAIFHGTALYSWYSCLPFQFVVLPLLAYWGYATQRKNFLAYLTSPWRDLDTRAGIAPERVYLCTIYGYLFKVYITYLHNVLISVLWMYTYIYIYMYMHVGMCVCVYVYIYYIFIDRYTYYVDIHRLILCRYICM